MKKLIILMAVITNFQAFAESKEYRRGKITYSLVQIQGSWVSPTCKKLGSCLALTPPSLKSRRIHAANPFADFCRQASGEYITATDKYGFAKALCIFADESYAIAQDYYLRFRSK